MVFFLNRQLHGNQAELVICETSKDPSFSNKKAKVVNVSCNKVVAGVLNSIWPTKSKMERQMLHQVGHPPQNASDIAKHIVGLAGHSASPHSTALVLNVSPSTA